MEKRIKYLLLFVSLTVIAFLQSAVSLYAQEEIIPDAIAEKISGVPVFLYCKPVSPYKVLGKAEQRMEILQMDIEGYTSVRKKAELMVASAKDRVKTGLLDNFDAILVDTESSKTYAITFTSENSLKAKAQQVRNISVFFFSKPVNEYDVIAKLPARFPKYDENGLLQDKVKSMINRALRKVKSGDISKFDGVIFNPDDLSATIIKFK